jgi:WD40 repeat protein
MSGSSCGCRRDLASRGLWLGLACALTCLVSAANGQQAIELSGHAGYVEAIAFSPDSTLLAAFAPGELSVWRLAAAANKRLVTRFSIGPKEIYSVLELRPLAFSPDGKTIAVYYEDGRDNPQAPRAGLKFFGLDGKETRADFRVPRSTGAMLAYFAYSPNGTEVVYSLSGHLEARELATDRVRKLSVADSPVDDEINHMQFLSDGTLATARADGLIKFWDLKNNKLLKTIPTSTRGVYQFPGGGRPSLHGNACVSPDGKWAGVVSVRLENVLTLWNLETGKAEKELMALKGGRWINSLAWTPDSAYLAAQHAESFGTDTMASIFGVKTGKEVRRIELPKYSGRVHDMAFSPDGRVLAMCGETAVTRAGMDNSVIAFDVSGLVPAKAGGGKKPGGEAEKRDAAAGEMAMGE